MAKKLLCVIVFMLALVFVLASCGHKHEWSEWQITKEATCTVEGSKIRNCTDEECGATETEIISATGHSFGEWKTTKIKTCTEDGSMERMCSCGEKETKTIASTGHNFGETGFCRTCSYGWVNINLPQTPLTVVSQLASFEISDIRYELGRYERGYLVRVFYSGTQIYAHNNHAQKCRIDYKLVDSNGYTVCSDYTHTPQLSTGDKMKDLHFDYKYVNLDPNETYTLIITDSKI